jgi:hypothetical protein
MAIASVVLGALGISLPAIIVGHIARRRARDAGASSRLATVGMALGVLGLLAAVGLEAYKVNQADAHATRIAAPGQFITMQPQATQLISISKVDVYALAYPVAAPPDSGSSPPPGYVWALADVSECAGVTGSPFATDSTDFSVMFNGVAPAQGQIVDFIREPALSNFDSIAPNQCVRGYVAFIIPAKAKPLAVQYQPLLGHYDDYEWDLAG